jgi:hypothetical protein
MRDGNGSKVVSWLTWWRGSSFPTKASRARSLRTWPARSRIPTQADGPVMGFRPFFNPVPASGSNTPARR